VTSRRALHLVLSLCAAAAGCGDGGTPARLPPSTLRLTCGGYDAGLTGGLVLAAVLEPPPTHDVVLEVSQGVRRETVTCKAGARLCIETVPSVSTWGTDGQPGGGDDLKVSEVAWDLGEGRRGKSCRPDVGFVLPQPEGTVEVVDGKLRVKWNSVPGAARYAVTFRDLDLRPPELRQPRVLGRVETTETQAELELPAGVPELGVVELEAWALDPEGFSGDEVPAGGANRSVRAIPIIGAPWALLQPSDFVEGSLSLRMPAGSRLAVILLNVTGADRAVATLRAADTGPAARPVRPSAAVLARAGRPAPDAGPGLRSTAPPATRTFCTFVDPGPVLWWGQPTVRRSATLLLETANGLFYVDEEDVPGFTSAGLASLGAWWEEAYASVTGLSGSPGDVDGNGKFVVFLTGALGSRTWGFANNNDLFYPPDTRKDCGASSLPNWTFPYQSNGADMIHVHPPFGLEDDRGQALPDEVQWAIVKGQLPYLLQHMVDKSRFGEFYARDAEITHARMALAQTLAGSGNHLAPLRALTAQALFTRAGLEGGLGGYPALKLFPYDELLAPHEEVLRAGADAFILYLADRLGPAFVERFFDTGTGVRQVEAVSGIPFPIAYALWTGALVFSNEPSSPWRGFDYLGEDWTPLHDKFLPFEVAPLEAGSALEVTLRRNGFDVLVTGVAGPQGGAVTVTSSADVKPYVVAIPFQGELP